MSAMKRPPPIDTSNLFGEAKRPKLPDPKTIEEWVIRKMGKCPIVTVSRTEGSPFSSKHGLTGFWTDGALDDEDNWVSTPPTTLSKQDTAWTAKIKKNVVFTREPSYQRGEDEKVILILDGFTTGIFKNPFDNQSLSAKIDYEFQSQYIYILLEMPFTTLRNSFSGIVFARPPTQNMKLSHQLTEILSDDKIKMCIWDLDVFHRLTKVGPVPKKLQKFLGDSGETPSTQVQMSYSDLQKYDFYTIAEGRDTLFETKGGVSGVWGSININKQAQCKEGEHLYGVSIFEKCKFTHSGNSKGGILVVDSKGLNILSSDWAPKLPGDSKIIAEGSPYDIFKWILEDQDSSYQDSISCDEMNYQLLVGNSSSATVKSEFSSPKFENHWMNFPVPDVFDKRERDPLNLRSYTESPVTPLYSPYSPSSNKYFLKRSRKARFYGEEIEFIEKTFKELRSRFSGLLLKVKSKEKPFGIRETILNEWLDAMRGDEETIVIWDHSCFKFRKVK